MAGNHFRRNILDFKAAPYRFGSHPLSHTGDLPTRTVIDRDLQRQSRIVRRGFFAAADSLLHIGRESLRVADEPHPDPLRQQRGGLFFGTFAQQFHQRFDLARGTPPVFGRKSINCQILDPAIGCGTHHFTNALDTLDMAANTIQPALAGPSAVAIHNDSDMPGDPLLVHMLHTATDTELKCKYNIYTVNRPKWPAIFRFSFAARGSRSPTSFYFLTYHKTIYFGDAPKKSIFRLS